MKKNVTQKLMVAMAILSFNFLSFGQDIDLVPGINYSYNPINAQGILEIVEIDVCNNGWDNADPFDVTIYLYDQGTQDVYFVGTTRLTSGLSGSACITISNWIIDVNDTPGIPAGTYRVGFYVDSNEEIAETDEQNNAGLLSGNNTYSPGGTTSIAENVISNSLNIFPNPANDELNIVFNSSIENEPIHVFMTSLDGKIVKEFNSNVQPGFQFNETYSISNLPNGVYLVHISLKNDVITRKIVVSH